MGQINCVSGSTPVRSHAMCLSWFYVVYVVDVNHIVFQPKTDLISTIIVLGFLEIQSNNVPVDDKPYQDIF